MTEQEILERLRMESLLNFQNGLSDELVKLITSQNNQFVNRAFRLTYDLGLVYGNEIAAKKIFESTSLAMHRINTLWMEKEIGE